MDKALQHAKETFELHAEKGSMLRCIKQVAFAAWGLSLQAGDIGFINGISNTEFNTVSIQIKSRKIVIHIDVASQYFEVVEHCGICNGEIEPKYECTCAQDGRR